GFLAKLPEANYKTIKVPDKFKNTTVRLEVRRVGMLPYLGPLLPARECKYPVQVGAFTAAAAAPVKPYAITGGATSPGDEKELTAYDLHLLDQPKNAERQAGEQLKQNGSDAEALAIRGLARLAAMRDGDQAAFNRAQRDIERSTNLASHLPAGRAQALAFTG